MEFIRHDGRHGIKQLAATNSVIYRPIGVLSLSLPHCPCLYILLPGFTIPNKEIVALANVAQLVGTSPYKPKGRGFNSGQGTCLGLGLIPDQHTVGEAADRCFSPSLSLPLPSPLSKIKQVLW